MSKTDLKRSLEAELLKIERQDKKIYSTGETRYDLMIRDVLNYIDNSIPKEVVGDTIKEWKDKNYIYGSDYLIKTLKELLEGK